MNLITGPQIHAARALLGWSRRDLAEKAELGEESVQTLEASETPHSVSGKDLVAVCAVFEAVGVVFGTGEGIGVWVPRPSRVLDEHISALEDRIATRVTEGEISPERGMQRMRQGNDENLLRKLRARKAAKDE